MNKKILLVEDDENLGYILKEYLQMHDFDVVLSKDGEEGLQKFTESRFNLCILDIMLPKKDGLTLAVDIKNIDPNMPLIFLTAKSLKVDKLKGFKIGCDDYIVKPIDEEELIARIKAVLKRSSEPTKTIESSFRLGIYTFHPKNQQLLYNKNVQSLTELESEILNMLCVDKGALVERKKMLLQLWGETGYFKRRSMDVFISKLRKYLNKDPNLKITNIHGKGFILEEEHPV